MLSFAGSGPDTRACEVFVSLLPDKLQGVHSMGTQSWETPFGCPPLPCFLPSLHGDLCRTRLLTLSKCLARAQGDRRGHGSGGCLAQRLR
jgi:hypothetical protein